MDEIALTGEVHERLSISIARRVQVKCSCCGWIGRRVERNLYEPCNKCGGEIYDQCDSGYYAEAEEKAREEER